MKNGNIVVIHYSMVILCNSDGMLSLVGSQLTTVYSAIYKWLISYNCSIMLKQELPRMLYGIF